MGGCPSRPTDIAALGVCSLEAIVEGGPESCDACAASDRIVSGQDDSWRHASEGSELAAYYCNSFCTVEAPPAVEEVPGLLQDGSDNEASHPSSSPQEAKLVDDGDQEDVDHPDFPARMALSQNKDFAREFRSLSPEKVRSRTAMIIRDWEAKLKGGTLVLMDGERSVAAYDKALHCLDLPERGALYPLAALAECRHLPRKGKGVALELLVFFHGSEESLVFQFERGFDRAAFALTLHALAAEAEKDKWHEDRGCKDRSKEWDEETEDEYEYEGGSTDTGGLTPTEGGSTDTSGVTPDEAYEQSRST